MFIYPYKKGSKSVKALKDGLKAKTIRLKNSSFKDTVDKTVINWGSSTMSLANSTIINKPEAVAIASNKKDFFDSVSGVVSIPEYTTDKEEAHTWLSDGGGLLARTKLTGHSGSGIILVFNEETWLNLSHKYIKLYVRYIPKKDEYRIHVMDGVVVDIQRKATPSSVTTPNWKIRSHSNGWIFKRQGVEAPEDVIEQALLAVKSIGLDFGAVDVIYNTYRKKAYVLEVNTAPGLEGSTLKVYIDGLTALVDGVEPPKLNIKNILPSLLEPTTYSMPQSVVYYEDSEEEEDYEEDGDDDYV